MNNIISTIINLVENPKIELIRKGSSHNQANNMGEALEEYVKDLFANKVDYVVDACDTIETKKELIRECSKRNIKLISSMGTGNKLDPSKLKIIDIRKTSYDPIAKILRKMVKDEKIKTKIPVICSTEQPINTNSNIISSNSFVPPVAGLLITSYIINDIIDKGIIYEKK